MTVSYHAFQNIWYLPHPFYPGCPGCKKIYICTHKSIIGRISSTIGTSMMIDFSPYLPYTFQRGNIRNKMLYILISGLDKKLKWQCKHFPSLFHSQVDVYGIIKQPPECCDLHSILLIFLFQQTTVISAHPGGCFYKSVNYQQIIPFYFFVSPNGQVCPLL